MQVKAPDTAKLCQRGIRQSQLLDPRGFGAQSAIEMPPRTV